MHGGDYGGHWVNHNGDFSGDLWVTVPVGKIEPAPVTAEDGIRYDLYSTVKLPYEVCKAIVAAKIRADRVRELENATDAQVLYGG